MLPDSQNVIHDVIKVLLLTGWFVPDIKPQTRWGLQMGSLARN